MNTVPINEKLLQFIWQYGLFDKYALFTTCQQPVFIIQCGIWNKDQGPDFLFSKIRIGNTEWIGHVELHVLASHWAVHGHSKDPHYSNVVLHVVWEEDKGMQLEFPTIELKGRISQWMLERYAAMMRVENALPCGYGLNSIAALHVSKWLERMMAERMQEKKNRVLLLAKSRMLQWGQVFGMMMAGAMGGPKNNFAFEQMMEAIPSHIFSKIRQDTFSIEAFMLGWAGMIQEDLEEDYEKALIKEFDYLKRKFNLHPSEYRWHFFRMRPSAFPSFRLALLANLMSKTAMVFNESFLDRELHEWQEILRSVRLHEYWEIHFIPGIPSAPHQAALSKTQINHLLINAVIPFMMAYAEYKGQYEDNVKLLQWLHLLPPESNQVTEFFSCHGVKPCSSAESQALLQLKYNYCDLKNCLNCAFGKLVLEGTGSRKQRTGNREQRTGNKKL